MKTKRKRIFLYALPLLVVWIIIDINYPFKAELHSINAAETATLDGAMWRSYYEKKPVKLFMQSAQLMRNEFHFPFWRSYLVSYYAAKAAFAFKDGTSRTDYNKALPYLVKYYSYINNVSSTSFNVDTAASAELEWWIIRREEINIHQLNGSNCLQKLQPPFIIYPRKSLMSMRICVCRQCCCVMRKEMILTRLTGSK